MPHPRATPDRLRGGVIAAVLAVLVIIVIACALAGCHSPGESFSSSYQIGSWDPAYSSPMSDPYAPRSRLFESAGIRPGPRWSDPLQIPSRDTRWDYRYADPLWLAGPMARYRWRNTPYFRNGPTRSYYGNYPYSATW